MAASKTLMDYLQPSKRLKVSTPTTSSSSSSPKSLLLPVSSLSHSQSQDPTPKPSSSPSSTLTAHQKSRIEFNKFLAKSKRNLTICSQKVSKSKAEGVGFVELEDLLVEETWLDALPGEFQKPMPRRSADFWNGRYAAVACPFYPPQHLIFNALNSTPFDRVKAVIIGQENVELDLGVKVPSSLVNIFKELQQDLGCSIPSHGNLEKWAVQGVLLLNAVLTVRSHQANSHAKKGWEQFTDSVIRTISQKQRGVVFLLWGNSAQEKSRLIDDTKHHILKAAHPSGLSANRGFFGCSSNNSAHLEYV
ncbi:Uracil-DNA glycosylase, mitochondrial [Vitis vinifera]|uniref:Uracil-DNA glycosylase, mitochondrial n=1 Tax=Vitis vinifera TaxID=29760 RepID=A0A438C9U5_VITVI|nr:Uracil-DNA glycosylase, mitochondrial [Vitis vinifera]